MINLRDYFAAHAPAVPSDYQAKTWKEKEVIQVSPNRKEMRDVLKVESHAARAARWAKEYADEMMK